MFLLQLLVKEKRKSFFSQFKFLAHAQCILFLFFRTSTSHFWLSSVCFDAFKTSDIQRILN